MNYIPRGREKGKKSNNRRVARMVIISEVHRSAYERRNITFRPKLTCCDHAKALYMLIYKIVVGLRGST